MNVNVITSTGIIHAAGQLGVTLDAKQAKTISGHVCDLLANNPALARDPKLQKSLLQLYFLKAKLLQGGRKRKKTSKDVSMLFKMRAKYDKLLGRFRSRMRRAMGKQRQMQQSAAERWGDSSGHDFSFLSDPRLSTADKLQRLLIELSSKYDQKAEELMKKLSNASEGKKKKGWAARVGDALKSIGGAVGGCLVGPIGAMAGKLLGTAVGDIVGSKGGDASKKNEKVLEFELQRIMQRANQLFSMASQLQKNEHDTIKGIIGRMAV